MIANDIIKIIESYCPLSMQESWDKSGLQIGDINKNVNKVMIALNCDTDTISHCVNEHCDMLITHHPFLLDKIENYDFNQFSSKVLKIAFENELVVYSAHTSLDATLMNDWLIHCLKVKNVHAFKDEPMCKIGELVEPCIQKDFLELVQKSYHLEHFKYAGDVTQVSKIAVLGGSGADLIEALEGKVDAYLTGDTKYRHAKYAFDHHLLLIDINHHSESIMVDRLAELLKKECSVEVIGYKEKDYYTYL